MRNNIELLNFNGLDEAFKNNFSNAVGEMNRIEEVAVRNNEGRAVESNSSSTNVGIKIASIQAKKNEKKQVVKQKFIFTQPFTANAKLRKLNHSTAFKKVTYNIGDVIEGVVTMNKFNSEPPTFLQVNTGDSSFQIGFGGRGASVIEPYKEPTTQSTLEKEVVKTPEETTNTDNSKEKAPSESEGWSTKKKVIVGVSVVAALGTIFGILKWKKVI